MVTEPLDEEAIFKIAAELPADAVRQTYLLQVCGDDHALHDRVMALLRAHDEAPRFLQTPPGMTTMAGTPFFPAPGTRLGPYKLREQIGEGGMGEVFVAEQTGPADHGLLRPGAAGYARAAGAVLLGLPSGSARPSKGDHSPRSQAI
jgi:hypothetical protein